MILLHGLSGVLAVSWYPPGMKDDNGEPSEDIVPLILEVAVKYNVKVEVFFSSLLVYLKSLFSCFIMNSPPPQVVFHIEPYRGRNDKNMLENIKYIIEK